MTVKQEIKNHIINKLTNLGQIPVSKLWKNKPGYYQGIVLTEMVSKLEIKKIEVVNKRHKFEYSL